MLLHFAHRVNTCAAKFFQPSANGLLILKAKTASEVSIVIFKLVSIV